MRLDSIIRRRGGIIKLFYKIPNILCFFSFSLSRSLLHTHTRARARGKVPVKDGTYDLTP
jgi:hypothetical protein